MFNRSAVLIAVAGLLASSGFAMADATSLSLDPSTIRADDATAPQGALMLGLDKIGVGQPLSDAKFTIDGWIDSGYTYDSRHGSNPTHILPGPFNDEYHNHYMLNQTVLRFRRDVDTTKFDVGGMVELMYGSDAAKIHSLGLIYDDSDPGVNRLPRWQFDIPQMYVTVNVPVANGLQFMVGKFATLLGYEGFEANANSFYSHSWLFSAVPFTQTGVLGSLQVNDQFGVKLGVTRGWDDATEDNNGAVDVLGQFVFAPSKQLSFSLAYSIGPENADDTAHDRIALDPIVRWQATDALALGFEWLYVFDGGWNAGSNASTVNHAYGDVWGGALYAGYTVSDMLTLNARLEAAHGMLNSFLGHTFGSVVSASVYEITLGMTVTPLPKNDWLKGLQIRPEIRYDFTDSTMNKFFPAMGGPFKDQLTFGMDVIFQF